MAQRPTYPNLPSGGATPITITPSPAAPEGFEQVTLTFSSAPDSVTLLGPDGSDQSGLLAGSGTSYTFTPTATGGYHVGAVVGGSEVGSVQVPVGDLGFVLRVDLDLTAETPADWIGAAGDKAMSDGTNINAKNNGTVVTWGLTANGIELETNASGEWGLVAIDLTQFAWYSPGDVTRVEWYVEVVAAGNPGANPNSGDFVAGWFGLGDPSVIGNPYDAFLGFNSRNTPAAKIVSAANNATISDRGTFVANPPTFVMGWEQRLLQVRGGVWEQGSALTMSDWLSASDLDRYFTVTNHAGSADKDDAAPKDWFAAGGGKPCAGFEGYAGGSNQTKVYISRVRVWHKEIA